jgi:malonate decarboxylase delta subunit
MEQLEYTFDGRKSVVSPSGYALVGVVASGNLEVMIEPASLGGRMHVVIKTAARGFGTTWQAVLRDFSERHPLADVQISINDVGATPAVVSLRLDQAVEAFEEGDRP